jgi:hypothetical protein
MSELTPPINESLFLADIARLVTTPAWIQWLNSVGRFVSPTFGSADQKLFVQSDGKGTEFSKGYCVKGFSRDLTAATATGIAHNGAGFKPGAIVVIGCVEGTAYTSVGFSDFATNVCISSYIGGLWHISSSINVAVGYNAGTDYQTLTTLVATADGFTGTWTKDGSPTGTFGYAAFFLR